MVSFIYLVVVRVIPCFAVFAIVWLATDISKSNTNDT